MIERIAHIAKIIPAVFAVACAVGENSSDDRLWQGSREFIGSVEVVRNPATPLLRSGDATMASLWSAPADSSSAGTVLWEGPVAVKVAGERVYVLDQMANVVHVLRTSDGSPLRTIGRRGAGPGEVERPYAIAPLDGDLVVGNAGKASFEVFGVDGAYKSSVPAGALGFSAHSLPPARLLVNMLLGQEGAWRVVQLDGAIQDFAMPQSIATNTEKLDRCERVSTVGSRVLRAGCFVPHIQLIDDRATLLREILIPLAAEEATDAELNAHLAQVREIMGRSGLPPDLIEAQVRQAVERFAMNPKPKFRGVRQDADTGLHALWEQNPEDLGDGPAILHLLSRSGVYLTTLVFDQPWVDFDLAGSVVFALVRDTQTDLVELVALRLELPSGLPQ